MVLTGNILMAISGNKPAMPLPVPGKEYLVPIKPFEMVSGVFLKSFMLDIFDFLND